MKVAANAPSCPGPVTIGIDDTDGPSGGCTTFALTEVIRIAVSLGVDLIGAPRLVRLNPNVPWKTRGNAALSARFGGGRGPSTTQGRISGKPVSSYSRGAALEGDLLERFLEAAWTAVLSASDPGPRSDPAMVAFGPRPGPAFYYQAVRSVVRIPEARAEIRRRRGRAWTRGAARGLVGATAAAAWPGRRVTWELIGYRRPDRQGMPREVDPGSVRAAEARYPGLFQCYDPATRRLLVAPHTACPVLLGLRSTDAAELLPALRAIRSEPVERWMVFRTNQGTGDHLIDRGFSDMGPYESARIRGTVTTAPEILRGGHVRLEIADADGRTGDCWAFEPTKTLARVAASLRAGDRVAVWGGRGHDTALRIEGIEIVASPDRPSGQRPPRCRRCERRARSLGRGRGFRCPVCRARFPPEAAAPILIPPDFGPGIYHPTPSARRHLHPLPAFAPTRVPAIPL
jgi:tRNA(Ile2)-agmatinylcytidine synthase